MSAPALIPAPAPEKSDKKKKLSWREMRQIGWSPLLRLIRYLAPYKSRFILGLVFGALYGSINGIVPFLVSSVSGQVFGSAKVGGGNVIQMAAQVQSGAGHQFQFGVLLLVCAAIPVVMLLRSTFSYLNAYCMAWVSLRVLVDIRRQLFAHLTRHGLDFFNKERSGNLISRVANDTRVAQGTLTSVSSDLIKQPVALISGVVALLIFDPKFTLCVILVFPICLLPMLFFGRMARHAGQREEQQMAGLITILQETFAGIRVIKAFAREDFEISKFQKTNLAQFRNSMRVRRSTELVGPLVEVLAAIGVGLTLFYLYVNGATVERFLGLVLGIFMLYEPAKTLSKLHVTVQKGLSAALRVFELLDVAPTVSEAPQAGKLPAATGAVHFQNISFQYEAGAAALRQFSLSIPPGKTCALVGPSGAGKTTVLALLLRFYDPQEGVVTIDGYDIRECTLDSLREQIGIVNQDTFLFHDSIMNNIRYGRLDATDAEVHEAAKQAFAHDFILSQPEGYNTVIGDKGCRLSGGQQQRISIARALLKNAPILLLDEATSALDSESEREIQVALERLSRGRTVIVIAHRLSTILKADQIVVMSEGRVLQTGKHAELLQHSDLYRKLYELQFHHSEAA